MMVSFNSHKDESYFHQCVASSEHILVNPELRAFFHVILSCFETLRAIVVRT